MKQILMLRELPTNEKPRERLMRHGASSLSTSELLAIVLGKGTKNKNVLDLSTEIISKFRNLSEQSVISLSKIRGIGSAKACQILACFELGKRLNSSQEFNPTVTSPEAAYKIIKDIIGNKSQEHFLVLFLDTRKRLITHEVVFIGTLNTSIIHPREVFLRAIQHSSASIIIAHNHPSGDPSPSKDDLKITHQLIKAGQIIGIPVLDHIIIGINNYKSII